MIWKLAKYYKTPKEKIIGEYTQYKDALKLFDALNTEGEDLQLEIFFEDQVWTPLKNKFVLERFTMRSPFELKKITEEINTSKALK